MKNEELPIEELTHKEFYIQVTYGENGIPYAYILDKREYIGKHDIIYIIKIPLKNSEPKKEHL